MMLSLSRALFRNRWHVYIGDQPGVTGRHVWLATFRYRAHAEQFMEAVTREMKEKKSRDRT